MTRPPTSRDVAQRAGVSQSTVSYVMSGKRAVAAETRQRVLDAIDQLSYQPHSGARALKSRRSQVIGLMLPYTSRTITVGKLEFVVEVTRAFRRHSFDTLLVASDEGAEGLRRVAGTALCDGLLVVDVPEFDPRVLVAEQLTTPSVFLGVPGNRGRVRCVDTDFEQAGHLCVGALADAGHRRVALVGPELSDPWLPNFVSRFYRGAMAQASARGIELGLYTTSTNLLAIRATLNRVLADSGRLPGIVVVQPLDVTMVLSLLRMMGSEPGLDVSVVTSNTTVAIPESPFDPSFVDIRMPHTIARAAEVLAGLIHGDATTDEASVELISPELRPGSTIVRH